MFAFNDLGAGSYAFGNLLGATSDATTPRPGLNPSLAALSISETFHARSATAAVRSGRRRLRACGLGVSSVSEQQIIAYDAASDTFTVPCRRIFRPAICCRSSAMRALARATSTPPLRTSRKPSMLSAGTRSRCLRQGFALRVELCRHRRMEKRISPRSIAAGFDRSDGAIHCLRPARADARYLRFRQRLAISPPSAHTSTAQARCAVW